MGTTEVTGEGGVLEALAESHVAQTRLDFLETQPPLAEATSLTHIARAAFEQGVRKLGAAAAS